MSPPTISYTTCWDLTYFIALLDHALTRAWYYRELDYEYQTHPHYAWRLGRLAELVVAYLPESHTVDGSYRWQAVRDTLERHIALIPTDWRSRSETPEKEIIDNALAALEGRQLSEPLLIEYSGLAEDLEHVWGRLEANMAPAERIEWTVADVDADWPVEAAVPPWSTPIDWRSILNIGCFYSQFTDPAPPANRIADWRILDTTRREFLALLQGSVELSEIQLRAEELAALDGLAGEAPSDA